MATDYRLKGRSPVIRPRASGGGGSVAARISLQNPQSISPTPSDNVISLDTTDFNDDPASFIIAPSTNYPASLCIKVATAGTYTVGTFIRYPADATLTDILSYVDGPSSYSADAAVQDMRAIAFITGVGGRSTAEAVMQLAAGDELVLRTLYYPSSTPGLTIGAGRAWLSCTKSAGGDSGAVGAVATINFVIDGGGSAITSGIKGDIIVDFACTINSWTLLADVAGDIVVDVWKDSYGNFPPTDADTMPGSGNEPTIVSSVSAQDATVTGWTTDAIAAGDTLRFNVDSCATITRASLCLKVTRT